MMRRFARVPALWLALTGATLPQSVTPVAVLECKAPREASAAAFDTLLPITRSIDRSVAPDLDITHLYKVPSTPVFGLPLYALGASHIRRPDKDSMMFMSIIDAPYETVRDAALKSYGLSGCLNADAENCWVVMGLKDGWRQLGLVEDRDGRGVFTCTYARSED